MPNLDLLVRADDQASRTLKKVNENLKRAEGDAKRFGKAFATGGSQAERALRNTAKQANKTKQATASLSKVTAELKGSLLALLGAAAVVGFFKDAAGAAIEQERALIRLNNTLKLNGEFTEQNSSAIQSWAKATEQATGVSEDQIINLFALARGFANSAEQAQDLIDASLDFSIGAGLALEESVRRLGRGIRGSAADLANFSPEIRNLTKEQLAAGEATRIITERFKGQRQELARATGGIALARVEFEAFKEEIGRGLLPALTSLIPVATDIVRKFRGLGLFFGTLFANIQIRAETMADNMAVRFAALGDAIKSASAGSFQTAADRMRLSGLQIDRNNQELTENLIRTWIDFSDDITNLQRGITRVQLDESGKRLKISQDVLAAQTKAAEDLAKKRAEAEQELNSILLDLQAERDELAGAELNAGLARIEIEKEARLKSLEDLKEKGKLSDEELIESTNLVNQNAEEKGEALGEQFDKIAQFGKKAAADIKEGFADSFTDVLLEGKSLEEGMLEVFKGILREAIKTFTRIAIESALIKGAAGAATGGGFFGGLLGFQTGTQRVPGPVGVPRLAVVHGGESISTAGSPAGSNRASGGGGGGGMNVNLVFPNATLGRAEAVEFAKILTDLLRQGDDGAREFATEVDVAAERNAERAT